MPECGSQKTAHESQFFSPTIWVLARNSCHKVWWEAPLPSPACCHHFEDTYYSMSALVSDFESTIVLVIVPFVFIIHVCMYVCMCIYVCACIYACMHTCIMYVYSLGVLRHSVCTNKAHALPLSHTSSPNKQSGTSWQDIETAEPSCMF